MAAQFNPWDVLQNDPNMYLAQQAQPLPPEALEFLEAPETAAPTSTKSKASVKTTEVAPLSQSDYENLVTRLNSKGIESLRLQSQGIGDIEQMRNQLLNQGEVQTDLTPLMALVDSWSTTGARNNAATYSKPTSGEERQATIRQIQGQIQKAREGMSQNEIELLKSQLGIAAQREAALERAEAMKLNKEQLSLAKQGLRQDRLDKEMQRQREAFMKSDEAKVLKGTTAFATALDKYEAVVRQYGVEPVGKGAAALNNAYSDLKTAFKNIEELGALAGPDLTILASQVGGSEGVADYLRTLARGGKEGVLAQVAAAKKKAGQRFGENTEILKQTFPAIADEQTRPYQKSFDTTSASAKFQADRRSAAEKWLAANPNHPKAAQVRAKLGK